MMGWVTAHIPAGLRSPWPGCLTVSSHGPSCMPVSSQEHALGTHSRSVCYGRTWANLKGKGIVNRLRVNIKQKVIEICGEDLGSEEGEKRHEQSGGSQDPDLRSKHREA